MNENWSYTPGGLVTLKSYNNQVPDVVDGGGTEYGPYESYGYGSGVPPTYDNGRSYDGLWFLRVQHVHLYAGFAMGRPTGLTENGTGNDVWVQNAAYGPAGEMKTMQYRTSGGAYYFTENHTYQ